jgi:hypothetical protein
MHYTYSVTIKNLNLAGSIVSWTDFQSILREFIIYFKSKDELETKIINKLTRTINKLLLNVHKTIDYLNYYYYDRPNSVMTNLLTKGMNIYHNLVNIIEHTVSISYKTYKARTKSQDKVFIKNLLGVDKYLTDVLNIMNDARLWNDEIVSYLDYY